MKPRVVIWLLVIVIIINAGITMVLINVKQDPGTPAALTKTDIATRSNAITAAVEAVEPAVVSVNVIKTQVIRSGGPFGFGFFDFFGSIPMKRQVQSIGTGVIYDPKAISSPMRTWSAAPRISRWCCRTSVNLTHA